jgi:hypothetical protein
MSMRPGQAKGPSVTRGPIIPPPPAPDRVKVDAADTLAEYLDPKITVDGNITKAMQNVGLIENLLIGLSATPQVSMLYFGPSGVDGTWRIRVNGGELVFEQRVLGSYIQKGSVIS